MEQQGQNHFLILVSNLFFLKYYLGNNLIWLFKDDYFNLKIMLITFHQEFMSLNLNIASIYFMLLFSVLLHLQIKKLVLHAIPFLIFLYFKDYVHKLKLDSKQDFKLVKQQIDLKLTIHLC